MESIRQELIACLVGKRNAAIANRQYRRAYWLQCWIGYIRARASVKELAAYYLEYQGSTAQQLRLL